MKAILYINGYRIGEITYDHPKDHHGKTVVLPSADGPDVAQVVIRDEGSERDWITEQAKIRKM